VKAEQAPTNQSKQSIQQLQQSPLLQSSATTPGSSPVRVCKKIINFLKEYKFFITLRNKNRKKRNCRKNLLKYLFHFLNK
jgi:hypothetical protein